MHYLSLLLFLFISTVFFGQVVEVSHSSGKYDESISVEIAGDFTKAYYSIDGSKPSKRFSKPIEISKSTFLKIKPVFAGDSIAGVYASMEKLILAIKSMYSPLYQAIFPNLSTKPYDEIRSYIDKIRIPIGFFGLVISIIIFFRAKEILMLAFDDALIVGFSPVFQILGFISILSSLNMLYVTLYFPSIKKYKIRMKILVSGGFLNLIIALSLVKFYTIYGVAISAVITELFILILAIYFYDKKIKKTVS